MSAPALIIRLALEEPVRFTIDAQNDSEYARLADWIDTHHQEIIAAVLKTLWQERAA